MSEISFIPCELCDELISFEDYTSHINECQLSYRRSSINRRYGDDYVFISSQLRRPLISVPSTQPSPSDTPQQSPSDTPRPSPSDTPRPSPSDTPQPSPSDTPQPSPSDTLLPNINRLLNNENDNDIRTLENYLNSLISSYNEEERIFNEEYNRINRIYRISI